MKCGTMIGVIVLPLLTADAARAGGHGCYGGQVGVGVSVSLFRHSFAASAAGFAAPAYHAGYVPPTYHGYAAPAHSYYGAPAYSYAAPTYGYYSAPAAYSYSPPAAYSPPAGAAYGDPSAAFTANSVLTWLDVIERVMTRTREWRTGGGSGGSGGGSTISESDFTQLKGRVQSLEDQKFSDKISQAILSATAAAKSQATTLIDQKIADLRTELTGKIDAAKTDAGAAAKTLIDMKIEELRKQIKPESLKQ